MQLSIVLVGVEHPGNLGAVARAMANFGVQQLILIDPQCEITEETRNRAKHAQKILDDVTIGGMELLDQFDLVVATSGKLGDEYNIPRIPLTPEQLKKALDKREGNVALMFGRESKGLLNEELVQADFLVTIPATEEYPILNLSHAVTVILYELSKASIEERYPLANPRQKEELRKLMDELLAQMEFATPEKSETQRRVWHRLTGTFLTAREAQSLLGLLKKLKK